LRHSVEVKTNQLLFIVILNTPRSTRVAVERRHDVVRSFKICTVTRDWLPQAIVSLATDSRNILTLARKAVGEIKTKMIEMNATSSSSQASVAAALDNDVLMALPKRNTVARSLKRAREKATTVAGGTPLRRIIVS